MKSLPVLVVATVALLSALSACGSGADTTTTDAVDTSIDLAPEAVDTTELPDIVKDQDPGCPGECCDDPDCDDQSACTVDRCESGTCVHAPTSCDDGNACTSDSCDPSSGCHHESIPGCCVEGTPDTLLSVRFDESLEGVTVEAFGASSPTPATWQLSTLKYHSAARSLYFGIPDAGSYDNGKRVAARFTTPVVALPGNRLAEVSFWVWLDVDPGDDTDLFAVSALSGGARVPLFEKQAELVDRAWHQVTLDLTAFASSDVVLEFAFDSITATDNDFNGIYVDDVVVSSICTPPSCTALPGCDDHLACTSGACVGGACTFDLDDACCLSALDCRDGDACTHDLCDAATCRWDAVTEPGCCNTSADCDDDDPCTTTTCVDDRCHVTPSGVAGCCEVDADCDDGDACTTDACVSGGCVLLNACCTADVDCDDGDAVCTADFCVEGACVYQPTGVTGCCLSEIVALAFDDGSLGGLVLENSDPAAGWHVFGAAGASAAPTPALYYGDSSDATNLTYDTGTATWGTASLPLLLAPAGSAITLTFDAWLDTEESPDFDTLTFSLQVGDNRYLLWDKKQLVTTLAWHTYQVDLSAFAGLAGTLLVRFDTIDDTVNTGEGVYVDNLEVATSCTVRACQADIDCDDGLAATEARCLPNGQCSYALKNEPCAYDFECDDLDPCTADGCLAGFCEHDALAGCCKAATDCDDVNPCTVDTCSATNACQHAWTPGCCLGETDCDDADPCTTDQCPVAGQACAHAAVEGCCTLNLDCDDGLPDTDDACTIAGCVHRPIACVTTADCADGDACTSEACLAGTCAWLPVESPSCCQPLVLDVSFDDGTPGPFSLVSSAHDVRWQLSSARANSTPFALYYGDPATGSYDNGAANSGRVVSDTVVLPANTLLTFSFALWQDIEAAPTQDPLTVVVHTDLGPQVVWDKSDLAGPARAWIEQQVDLTAYAGQAVQLEFAFETNDPWANTGEGLYLDDVRLVSSCAPAPCSTDADCASFDACAPASCVQGLCLTLPTAGCCAANAECDDGNACTLDTCSKVGGTCAHAWKTNCCLAPADCDDANPCTADGCSAGGLCTHDGADGCCLTNADCDDHVGTTLDLCVQSACVHKPSGCATAADCDDADACTSAACLGGACAYVPVATPECCTPTLLAADFDQGSAQPFALDHDGWHVSDARYGSSAPASLYFGHELSAGAAGLPGATECDDLDPCTADGLDLASGACAHQARPDGAACDDADAATVNDTCDAGTCHGVPLAPPRVYRLDTLALRSPELVYDFGGGAAPINELLSAVLTARLSTLELGGMIAVFDQLQAPAAASVAIGEGQCAFADGVPVSCGLSPLGRHALLHGVAASELGSCHDDPYVAPPCFQTTEQEFDLGGLIPELFSGTQMVSGRAFGSFIGSPESGSIENGVVEGFVPRSLAAQLSFTVGGVEVTGEALMASAPVEVNDGVEGWTVRVGFTAVHVQHVAAPGTCGADPSRCDDHDPGTTDVCREGTDTCLHPARPSQPPTGSLADALPRAGSAISAPITLPPSSETRLSFSLFLDVEVGVERDPLLVRVLGDSGPLTVWDKLHLGPADYRRWLRQEVDLTGFQGQSIRIELRFDTVDTQDNEGEGVFVDDVRVLTTCAPRACTSDAGCSSPEPCRAAACVDGMCLTADVPECCVTTTDCQDADVCTVDACVDGTCAHQATPGCCSADADCDDGAPCTLDTCTTGNQCTHAYDAQCAAPLPYLQPFSGATTLGAIGWLTRNQAGGAGTNWEISSSGGPFDAHLMFDDTPVVQSYAHRAISPRLSAPTGTPITLQWRAFFEAYTVATTETTCKAEISSDDGATWKTVWTATYKKTGSAAEPASYDVTADLAGATQARVAFSVSGSTSYDLLGWHVDDVRVLTGLPPEVDVLADATVQVADVTEIPVAASDPEGQALTARLLAPEADWIHLEDRTGGLFALVVEPTVDQIGEHTVSLRVTDGQFDVERSFALTVTSSRILLAENFDTAPTLAGLGWSTTIDAGTVPHWGLTPGGGINGTQAAEFDWYPSVTNFSETLISPTFDASSAGTDPVQLVFTHRLDLSSSFQGTLTAKVSADNGATWTPAWTHPVNDADDIGPETVVVPVSELLAAAPEARLGFTLAGKSTSPLSAWQIDTVRVLRGSVPEFTPVPPQKAVIGKARDIVLHASDADGDGLTFQLLTSLPFLTLQPLGPNAALLRAKPGADDWGTHTIEVVVTDGLFSTHLELTLAVQNEGETVLLHETFDALTSLAAGGWSLTLGANPDLGTHWRLVATSDLGTGGAAQFYWSPGVYAYSESLVSPILDATAIAGQNAQVGFSHVLDVYSATTLTLALLVSADGGQTWSEAWTRDTFDADGPADVGPESVLVDLTPWLPGAAEARIAFRIAGDDSYALNGWYVDEVLLLGLATP